MLQVRASLEPVDRHWLKKRLSAMALVFGHERDPERASAWLAETGRLLVDLPGEILATSIDEAIKRSERGFMPAVGQIRAIAEPMLQDRQRELRRLEALVRLIDDDGRPAQPAAPPPEFDPADRCTPEQAAAIRAEFGLAPAETKVERRHFGPARRPTEADYIAVMGEAAWQAAKAAGATT